MENDTKYHPESGLSTDDAFQQLKDAMANTLVLALPNFSKVFIVETDASSITIGANLSQQGYLITYFSKKLSPYSKLPPLTVANYM